MCWIYDLTSSPYPKLFPHGWNRFVGGHHGTFSPASAFASLATTLNRLLLTFSLILGKIAKAAGFTPFLGLIHQHLLVADRTPMQAFQEMLSDLHIMVKEEFRTVKPDLFLFPPSCGSLLLLAAIHEVAVFSKRES